MQTPTTGKKFSTIYSPVSTIVFKKETISYTIFSILRDYMAPSSITDATQMDRLSILPEALLITILSLLPTRIAARTSVLSRCFRNLWKACHAVDISFKRNFTKKSDSYFNMAKRYIDMANSALLSRKPSNDNPLLSLHLNIPGSLPPGLTHSFFSSLLAHARSLGVRHLTMQSSCHFETSMSSVFSITSLESLSIHIFSRVTNFPSATNLTRLKSLSIHLHSLSKIGHVDRLLLELSYLEHLQIIPYLHDMEGTLSLSSLTIKKLELVCDLRGSVGLFMPSLEFFYLSNRDGSCIPLPHFHGDIPSLRKAVITLHYIDPHYLTSVAQLLNSISHAEELSLDLGEDNLFWENPFGVLLEPGKEAPYFPNLKHLDACMCFHEHNFEATVSLLRRSPVLQSLKLVHKAARSHTHGIKKNPKDWRSKLPRNADGNNQQACFSNLHLKENNQEFMKLLNKKSTRKKQKIHH